MEAFQVTKKAIYYHIDFNNSDQAETFLKLFASVFN